MFPQTVESGYKIPKDAEIFNFELPLENRIKLLLSIGDYSTIQRLISILRISNNSIVGKTLFHVCKFCTSIPTIWRLDSAMALIDFDKVMGLEALDYVCFSLQKDTQIPFSCKVNAYTLLYNDSNKKRVFLYFDDFFNNDSISYEYKYKVIRDLINRDDSPRNLINHCISTLIHFGSSKDQSDQYHLLTCQAGLMFADLECFTNGENELLIICQSNCLASVKANAADMLLCSGSEKSKLVARNVLTEMSFNEGDIKTVYNNSENVHTESINFSALNTISMIVEEVSTYDTFVEFDRNCLISLLEKHDVNGLKNIFTVFYKIDCLEVMPYTKHNLTLKTIMNNVWTFINYSLKTINFKTELEKRFLEELGEMHNTCSSGYITRFANVFTGFIDDFGVSIGWEDQILSLFYLKMNNAIKTSQHKDLILEQMTSKGSEFKKLLITTLPDIIETIKKEFSSSLSETDIDLYIRKALSEFEGFTFK